LTRSYSFVGKLWLYQVPTNKSFPKNETKKVVSLIGGMTGLSELLINTLMTNCGIPWLRNANWSGKAIEVVSIIQPYL